MEEASLGVVQNWSNLGMLSASNDVSSSISTRKLEGESRHVEGIPINQRI